MNEHDEELKQEVDDLKDSDNEAEYKQLGADAGEEGENIEDNIDDIKVGGKRKRTDNQLEKQLDRK